MELEEQVKALQEEVATLQYRSSTPIPSSALCSLLPPQGQSSSTDDVMSPTPVTPSSAHSQLVTQGSSTSLDIMLPPIPVPTIDTSLLWTVQEVLTKHGRDINVCSAGRLCCKLARYAFFEDVMRACTPLGMRDRPGLPSAELARLKETKINQFPLYIIKEVLSILRECGENALMHCNNTVINYDIKFLLLFYCIKKMLSFCGIYCTYENM